MAHSRCRAEGRLNDRDLHLDHDPPLTDDERKDWRNVCDPRRVGFLCASDHARKTLAERAGPLYRSAFLCASGAVDRACGSNDRPRNEKFEA
jgi:hypothetical protein